MSVAVTGRPVTTAADVQLRRSHAPPTTPAPTTAAAAATRLQDDPPTAVGHAGIVPGTVASSQRGHVAITGKDAAIAAHVAHAYAGPPACHYAAGCRPVQPVHPSLLRQHPAADGSISATAAAAANAAQHPTVPDAAVGRGA